MHVTHGELYQNHLCSGVFLVSRQRHICVLDLKKMNMSLVCCCSCPNFFRYRCDFLNLFYFKLTLTIAIFKLPRSHVLSLFCNFIHFVLTQGYKFGSEKASTLNTYATMKSDGGQRAPPPAATSMASPIPGVHTSTLVSTNSQT